MMRAWRRMSEGIRSMLGRQDPRAGVRAALDELHGIKPSERRLPEIDDALKLSPSELYASKTGPELRKLANYAYHGVGTDKNLSLATGLWSAGAMKGDLECTYSVGQALLQGVGIAEEVYGGPNESAAEEVFEEILKQVPHGWSMFSLATILTMRHSDVKTDEDRRGLARALTLYRRAAEQGVAPACLNVSNMHMLGIGTEVNTELGMQWLVKAAKAGDPIAQVQLATRLSRGEDVGKDEGKAFRLFERAAQTGRPTSLFNVGVAYLAGQGVEADEQKAVQYFKEAAETGFMPAKVNLALMHERGQGVPQDFDKALSLLQEVADAGYEEDVRETLQNVRMRRDQAMGGMTNPVNMGQLGGGAPPPSSDAGAAAASAAGGVAGAPPVSSTTQEGAGLLFESKPADPRAAAMADTLEVHLDAGANPEAAQRLLQEANQLTSMRRDEVVRWIEKRAKEEGIAIKAVGIVPAGKPGSAAAAPGSAGAGGDGGDERR
mmetsp:Transcript_4809/g.20612  ORF Transcript_4809/g.20612 Transcript_4809/m.20612 type:complete len:492 (-) Transcript_4809:119-1594(-)